jgi:hypothetical protein
MSLEETITEFFTNCCKRVLFFLEPNHQSLVISVFHYIIFIIGFYYFFFHSNARDYFRIFFFIFILSGLISYFTINRCILTSIELKLSKEKNLIQKTIDNFFGKEIEGNITSKIVFVVGTIILGYCLLNDYGYINFKYTK